MSPDLMLPDYYYMAVVNLKGNYSAYRTLSYGCTGIVDKLLPDHHITVLNHYECGKRLDSKITRMIANLRVLPAITRRPKKVGNLFLPVSVTDQCKQLFFYGITFSSFFLLEG